MPLKAVTPSPVRPRTAPRRVRTTVSVTAMAAPPDRRWRHRSYRRTDMAAPAQWNVANVPREVRNRDGDPSGDRQRTKGNRMSRPIAARALHAVFSRINRKRQWYQIPHPFQALNLLSLRLDLRDWKDRK